MSSAGSRGTILLSGSMNQEELGTAKRTASPGAMVRTGARSREKWPSSVPGLSGSSWITTSASSSPGGRPRRSARRIRRRSRASSLAVRLAGPAPWVLPRVGGSARGDPSASSWDPPYRSPRSARGHDHDNDQHAEAHETGGEQEVVVASRDRRGRGHGNGRTSDGNRRSRWRWSCASCGGGGGGRCGGRRGRGTSRGGARGRGRRRGSRWARARGSGRRGRRRCRAAAQRRACARIGDTRGGCANGSRGSHPGAAIGGGARQRHQDEWVVRTAWRATCSRLELEVERGGVAVERRVGTGAKAAAAAVVAADVQREDVPV